MEPNKKFKLVTSKKTRYLLPNILTLGGVCLGISSIKFSIDGNFNLAVILILLAAILDALDGRVARLIKGTSEFGKELIRAGRWDEDLEEGTSKALKRLEEFLGTSVFCFPRFGLLGGFKGGPTKLVTQLHSAIVRAVLKESSK